MEYDKRLKLEVIRDQYPAGPEFVDDSFSIPPPRERTIDESYETENPTTVKVTGKYDKNFLFVDTVPLDDINITTLEVLEPANARYDLTFRFIVKFVEADGSVENWTSQAFYDDLVEARNEDNPYFTLNYVTIVSVNFSLLSAWWLKREFTIKQKYAEVEITDTINTKEDMLVHINWMVSSAENLRPVRRGDEPFGDWEVKTTESFGFEWADEVKAIDLGDDIDEVTNVDIEGLANSTDTITREDGRSNLNTDTTPRGEDNTTTRTDSNTIDGSTRSGTISTRTTTDTTDNTTIRTDEPITTVRTSSIGQQWFPFSSGGRYTGEVRSTADGTSYIWTGVNWEVI